MVKVKRFGFTLVELMTVIAIIGLLLGILIPSVRHAQLKARETSVSAQISTLAQGLEMFKTDYGYYPSSVPQKTSGAGAGTNASMYREITDGTGAQVDTTYMVQGFHRIAFALLGRDRLGCPAQRGTSLPAGPDPGPDSLRGFYYTNDATFSGTWLNTNAWAANNKTARRGPYINPEGFTIINDGYSVGAAIGASSYVPVLCDKFNKVQDNITGNNDYADTAKNRSIILYFAANEQGKRITPYNTTTGMPTTPQGWSEEIYYASDNWQITGGETSPYKFRQFIEDPKSKIVNDSMPHNRDSYLLISPGYDGKYFTGDDIKNWAD